MVRGSMEATLALAGPGGNYLGASIGRPLAANAAGFINLTVTPLPTPDATPDENG
jgi:hypothetical protein